VIEKIILASMIVIPFFCFPGWGDGIRAPKEALTIMAMFAVICSVMWKRVRIVPYLPLMALSSFAIVLAAMPNLPLSMGDAKVVVNIPGQIIAYKTCLYVVLGCLFVQCIASCDFDIRKISVTVSYIALAMCMYSCVQMAGLDEFFRAADPGTGWVAKSIWEHVNDQAGSLSHRVVATIGNPTLFGVFLSLLAPFVLYARKYIFLAPMALVIIITDSSTAMASLVVGIGSYIFFSSNRRTRIAIALAAIGLSILVISNLKSINVSSYLNPTGRIEVINEAFKIWNKKAITGIGLGSFEYRIGLDSDVAKRLNNQNWKEMHNEYLQWTFEAGIIGLVILLWVVHGFVARFKHTREAILAASALLAFAFSSFFQFTFRVSPISFYGLIIVGLYLQKTKGVYDV
jgi:O-antigen ligase